jgi:CheY-like chemotaxis protein
MRVLIVEDEIELGDVFREFLLTRGSQAHVVRSAEDAVAWLRTSRPQVILLDVKLPGMSGLDFMMLPLVRELGVPVIVISGHATEAQARACLRQGALEFLSKPVPLEILGAMLERAEPFAILSEGPGGRERRTTQRVPASLPVRIVTERGDVAVGQVVEVSRTGLRAKLDVALRVGAALRASITLPDDGGPLEVIALVVRADPDGVAVWFLDMEPAEADRLLSAAR